MSSSSDALSFVADRDGAPLIDAEGIALRLGWLRPAVLGANDGIVSTAGLVVGVAAATTNATTVLVAGLVALVAGAFSMASGEYVSVAAHRDAIRAAGTSDAAHPWLAAWSSAAAFTAGSLVPVAAAVLAPGQFRVAATMVAVLCALAATGVISARLGASSTSRAVLRNVAGGCVAMVATFAAGTLLAGVIAPGA